MCSGKVYWDLVAERTARGDTSTAIVRLEQLAPLPVQQVLAVLSQFPNAEPVWVQEEPANQGGWWHVAMGLFPSLAAKLRLVSRPASASPAAGSAKRHQAEQRAIVEDAFRR